jgi:two-component system NarL family sensor kinase
MTATSVAIPRPRSAAAGGDASARLVFGAIVAVGAALLLLASLLTVLVAAHDVPAAGHPGTWHQVTKLVATMPLLPLGALMVARLPRNAIGWLLCATALGTAISVAAQEYAVYSHFVDPLPAEVWLGWIGQWSAGGMIALVSIAPLLFPTGRLPSRRWRPALWVGIAAQLFLWFGGLLAPPEDLTFLRNPISNASLVNDVSQAGGIGWFLMLPAFGAGIAALVVRRRTATREVAEQIRLLIRAAVVVAVAFTACLIWSFAAPRTFDAGAAAAWFSVGFLAGTMAVAILRHRLYGLDVYVNRWLVFTALTVVLGGLYVAVVLGLGRLLGQNTSLGVALPATAAVAVAFQPVRERLQRSVNRLLYGQRDEPYTAISSLGRRLGEAIGQAEMLSAMVETIADALRLPYVAVELASPAGLAAVHGAPAAGVALRLPLVHGGEPVGTLLIGARAHGETLGDGDRRLLEDFARHAAAAVSAIALSTEVQRSRERLVAAREEERRRLSGDLHDGLGPTLAGAILMIEAARAMVARDPVAVERLLDRVAASLETTVADVRRLVYGLRPPALDQLGLVEAIRQQAAALSAGGERQSTYEVVAPDPMPPLPAAVEVAVFRIAQEALTNVARHAHARNASVTIAVDGTLRLEIRDDGRGLAGDIDAGVGLISMRERTAELGGSFELGAAPHGGTRLTVQLPLAEG